MKERKIIGYRVAIIRPYGPDGKELEVSPVGKPHTDQAQAELAACDVDHAVVIDLNIGRSSADPDGPTRSHRWRMVCLGENYEATFPTWPAAAATLDGVHKLGHCGNEHRIVTRDDAVRKLLIASENASI